MSSATYEKTVLDNGLRIFTTPLPHTRSVCISFFIGAGSRYESPETAGLSHFIEHLLFKGTLKFPTAQAISEAIEEIRATLDSPHERVDTLIDEVIWPDQALGRDVAGSEQSVSALSHHNTT